MSFRQISNGTKMDPMQWTQKGSMGLALDVCHCVVRFINVLLTYLLGVCANLFMGNTDNS